MKYIRLFFLILFLPQMAQAGLEIEAFHLFEGNYLGEYKDDLVICLSDGSKWKVHPQETHLGSNFEIGDPISISIRKSSYIKRDHKFRLHNRKTGQAVKTMIIEYNIEPLTVLATHERCAISHNYLLPSIPIFNTVKDVILSNDSLCTVKIHLSKFVPGAEVYLVTYQNSEDLFPFLIIGKEKDSVYESFSNSIR